MLETSGATSENLKVVSVAGCLGYDVLDEWLFTRFIFI